MKLAVAGLNFRAFDLLNVDRIAIEKCVCCAPLFSARGEREKCLESWKMKKMKTLKRGFFFFFFNGKGWVEFECVVFGLNGSQWIFS